MANDRSCGAGAIALIDHGRSRGTLDEQLARVADASEATAGELSAALCDLVQVLATAVDAQSTYVWVADGEDGSLVLRAASEQYAQAVGRLRMQSGEGFAGWVARHGEPISIADGALSDPRARYFPELDEEKFQSMTSVPLVANDGTVVGALGLHLEAPRTLGDEHARLVRSAASIVASAIRHARSADASEHGSRELDGMARISLAAAEALSLGDLLPTVAYETRQVMGARAVHVYVKTGSRRLRRGASSPSDVGGPSSVTLDELASLQIASRAEPPSSRPAVLAVPLAADGEVLGYLVIDAAPDRALHPRAEALAAAIAAQAAVGVRKLALAHQQATRQDVRALFEALALARPTEEIEAHLRRVGLDPRHATFVLEARAPRGASPPPHDRPELTSSAELGALITSVVPRAVCDLEGDVLRAVFASTARDPDDEVDRLRRTLQTAGLDDLAIGISGVCRDVQAVVDGFTEASLGARLSAITNRSPVTPADLGPYRYLLAMDSRPSDRDPYRVAIRTLLDHDRRRSTDLLRTLELYLHEGTVAPVARLLYIHPNTLRQRLRRIEHLTTLDLRRDDRLTIEIAIRLVRLEAPSSDVEPARETLLLGPGTSRPAATTSA